jgi:acyl carrier protein
MIDKNKLIKIISKALNVSTKKINDKSSSENLTEWDSLGHLAILTSIDNYTSGKASKIESLSSCTSFKDLYETLVRNNIAI